MIKTYRGQLADGGQDQIRLQTINGKMGYRIIKFQIMDDAPGTANQESIVKIYKTEQSSTDGGVNFTDSALLGAAFLSIGSSYATPVDTVIIFDREIFNQDIFITHADITGSRACNYYLELEVIPLASAEAAITTVKAMRGTAVD
tara:strand:+ start:56 stop:490 length:435 start_codon:yes stop_codon:yes gene_type:complete